MRMKLFSVFTAVTILTMTAFGPALAQTSADKEGLYNAVILELETYLADQSDDLFALSRMTDSLDDLRGYKESKGFGHYITILKKVTADEFDFQLQAEIRMITSDSYRGFRDYLSDVLAGSSIRSVENLVDYAAGREYEHEGRSEEAIEAYGKCLNFYDADDRYQALEMGLYSARYEEAMQLLSGSDPTPDELVRAYTILSGLGTYKSSAEYAEIIVELLGYRPEGEADIMQTVAGLSPLVDERTGSVTLSWLPSEHADRYTVSYHENGALHTITVYETQCVIQHLLPETEYVFRVAAVSGEYSSAEASVTVFTPSVDVAAAAVEGPAVTLSPVPTIRPEWQDVNFDSIITFGHYEQDDDPNNGMEPVEWRVLDIQDGKALVISRYSLAREPYHSINEPTTWENSTIRSWLNRNFLNTAFSRQEQTAVLTVQVDNDKQQAREPQNSPEGNATQDKIFLLSYREVCSYLRSESDRVCEPSLFALNKAAKGKYSALKKNVREPVSWMLRTMYYSMYDCVGHDGGLDGGVNIHNDCFIRPAFWLDLTADIGV